MSHVKEGLQSRAKKRFGQHFLVDPNVTSRIVDSLESDTTGKVLEIGPGRGALTSVLVDRNFRLSVLERDPDLAFEMKHKWPGLDVIIGDALAFSYDRLPRAGFARIVGNLPYNIASPLIWTIAPVGRDLGQCVFMVQKEVAQRIVSPPGSKEYGILSAWVQSYLAPRLLFPVSPHVFRPKPQVMSAVVDFHPQGCGLWPGCTPEGLSKLLHLCFQHRRKQVGTILRARWTAELDVLLGEENLDKRSRPERISPRLFQKMAALLDS
ncbi:MAG: 16S rRNA (adenine(1518)-N(6)/adenine(1519)-N(6))-dimethyltransferase RsmA [Desulfovibrionales bacterium]